MEEVASNSLFTVGLALSSLIQGSPPVEMMDFWSVLAFLLDGGLTLLGVTKGVQILRNIFASFNLSQKLSEFREKLSKLFSGPKGKEVTPGQLDSPCGDSITKFVQGSFEGFEKLKLIIKSKFPDALALLQEISNLQADIHHEVK
jgi:hypothetical protein